MARLVARLKACPDEELEFSHRLLQPLWSVMLRRSSKSATPLQSAVAKNASVNHLESAVVKTLDLKFRGMNSYKKEWGYPPVEAPVRPSKTKISAFLSRAGVSCMVVDFAERMACKRVSQVPVPMLTCAEHILGGLPARCETCVGARAHLRRRGLAFGWRFRQRTGRPTGWHQTDIFVGALMSFMCCALTCPRARPKMSGPGEFPRMIGQTISHYRILAKLGWWRDGRGVRGPGHHPGPPRGLEIPLRRTGQDPRSAGTLPPRGTRGLRAEPSQHLHHSRDRAAGWQVFHRHGVPRRANAKALHRR